MFCRPGSGEEYGGALETGDLVAIETHLCRGAAGTHDSRTNHAGAGHAGARLTRLGQREDREVIEAFRALVDHIVVHDVPDGGVKAEVIGRLTALLGQPAGDTFGGWRW